MNYLKIALTRKRTYNIILKIISSIALYYYLTKIDKGLGLESIVASIICIVSLLINIKNIHTNALIVAWIFSFMTLQGILISSGKGISIARIATIFAGSADISLIVYYISAKANSIFKTYAVCNNSQTQKYEEKNVRILSEIIMFACWIPTWLAFFPGLFTNDVVEQAVETFGSYRTHHPLLHTLFLQVCLYMGRLLGNINIGVALNCTIQMLIMAASLSSVISYMYYKRIREAIIIATQLFFSLFPVFPIMSISTTKDTLFTAFFTLLILEIVKIENNDTRLNKHIVLKLSAFGALSMLLRNNAIYVIPLALLLMCIKMRKKSKKYIYVLVLTILIYTCTNTIMIAATKAKDDPNHNEMLSVPYQQIARTYTLQYNELSDEEREKIEYYIPNVEEYNPIKSDRVKEDARADHNISDFIQLYIKLLLKYPMTYFDAFLINTQGYWYINDTTAAIGYGTASADGTVGYMYMYIWQHLGVEHKSLLPLLEKSYYYFFAYNHYLNLPLISILFRCAIYIWMIIAFWIASKNRNRSCTTAFSTVIMLLITLLFGPVCILRYTFPFFSCFPIFFITAYGNEIQTHFTTNK